jgi:hypothetical protein
MGSILTRRETNPYKKNRPILREHSNLLIVLPIGNGKRALQSAAGNGRISVYGQIRTILPDFGNFGSNPYLGFMG